MQSIESLNDYCHLRNKSIAYNKNKQVTGFNGFDYRLFEMKEGK